MHQNPYLSPCQGRRHLFVIIMIMYCVWAGSHITKQEHRVRHRSSTDRKQKKSRAEQKTLTGQPRR